MTPQEIRALVLRDIQAPRSSEDDVYEDLAAASLVMFFNRMFPKHALLPRSEEDT